MAGDGWPALFTSAFRQSRNPMLLVDGERRIVDANGAFVKLLGRPRRAIVDHRLYEFVAGGPLMTPREWTESLALGHFTGQGTLVTPEGQVGVQFAATTEVVTGRRLVLVVALSTSRWGGHFRRDAEPDPRGGALSRREREVVRRVALGDSGPEMAEELGIAHDTVRTHVRNAMTKLGARSRAHLVAKAMGEGFLEL